MVPLDDIALQEKLKHLLAASAPAWLWDGQLGIILWANRNGVAFWGEVDLVRLTERRFDHAMPGIARIRALAGEDFRDGERAETLLFWSDGNPCEITCRFDSLTLAGGQRALLVIGTECDGSTANADANVRLNGGEDGTGRNSEGPSAARLSAENTSNFQQRWRAQHIPHLDNQDRIALEEIASLVRTPQTPHQDQSGGMRSETTPQAQASADTINGPDVDQISWSGTTSFAAHIGQTVQSLFETLPIGIAICRDREMIFANSVLAYAFGYDTPRALLDAGGLTALFPTDNIFTDTSNGSGETPFKTKNLAVRSRSGRQHKVCVLLGDTLFDPKPVQIVLILPLSWSGTALKGDEPTISLANEAADRLTDGLLTLDRNGCLLDASAQARSVLDGSLDDFMGRPLTELVRDQDAPRITRALHRLEGRAPALGQTEMIQIWVQNTGSPVGPIALRLGRSEEARPAYFWAALVDLRQIPAREPEVSDAAASPLSAADKSGADVLAKISHEVRTPLNSIIGFSEIMKDERFGPVGHAKYQGYLNDIYDSAYHALSLINDLLDISKIQAGAFDIAPTAVDVNRTLEQCLRTLSPQAEQARIVIRSSLAASLPPLSADERCLKQILLNLISNGIKFTGAGGQVIARTFRNKDGGLRIRIRDTGVGMSDDEIAQALQPFLQLDTAPRRQIGSGLGLPLAKALSEANGASFSISSTPGKGTQVDLDFAASLLLLDKLDAEVNEKPAI